MIKKWFGMMGEEKIEQMVLFEDTLSRSGRSVFVPLTGKTYESADKLTALYEACEAVAAMFGGYANEKTFLTQAWEKETEQVRKEVAIWW